MIVYQDIMSTIKLIDNGRANSELTRHISIGYFWAHDLIHQGIICDKQRYYLDLAKSRGRIGSIASQQCLYQLSILCK